MYDYERLLYYMYSVLNADWKRCRYPYIRANDDIKIINMGILTRTDAITSAIAILKRKRFIEAAKIRGALYKAYYLTDEGISFCKSMFNKSSVEQPKEIEEEQPKQNDNDYSDVKRTKNYKILFVKLMDMIIETPEFKNDVSLIIRILTDLKNDGWFSETPDGRYPISDDAVKGYTQFMNEEGRKIIDKEVSKNNENQQPKQNTINIPMSYNDLMRLCSELIGYY
jgi:hypothetical protein